VGVRATVADRVVVVVDAHDGDGAAFDVEALRGAGRDVARGADADLRRRGHATVLSSLPPTSARSATAASGTGSCASTSSKKPVTTSRSATAVGTPRLSR